VFFAVVFRIISIYGFARRGFKSAFCEITVTAELFSLSASHAFLIGVQYNFIVLLETYGYCLCNGAVGMLYFTPSTPVQQVA
jgi:hypothetical protein